MSQLLASVLVTLTAAQQATATSEGMRGSATMVVAPVATATVSITPGGAHLPVGGTMQLAVTLRDANGNMLTGRTVEWASSEPTVATASASGLVTDMADDGGTATITATSGGKSGSSNLTVRRAQPPPRPS